MEKTSWTYDPSTTYIMYISNDLCYFVICHLTRCSLADPNQNVSLFGMSKKSFPIFIVCPLYENERDFLDTQYNWIVFSI